MRAHFSETDFRLPSRHFVAIDIDGTLVYDGLDAVSAETLHAVRALAERHAVCLVSNGNDALRNARVAQSLSVPYVRGKKPYGRAAAALRRMNADGLPFAVIGDRCLTDGLLALRLGGAFMAVRPLRAGKESLLLRLSYAFHESVTVLALSVIPWFRRP